MKLDHELLGLPIPPSGYVWHADKADWLDGDVFNFPMPGSLTVWLKSGDNYQSISDNARARPNQASIRRAANKALKRHFARKARQVVDEAKAKRAAERFNAKLTRLGGTR